MIERDCMSCEHNINPGHPCDIPAAGNCAVLSNPCKFYSERVEVCDERCDAVTKNNVRCTKKKGHLGRNHMHEVGNGCYLWEDDPKPCPKCQAASAVLDEVFSGTVPSYGVAIDKLREIFRNA